jgi:hypothetical protein
MYVNKVWLDLQRIRLLKTLTADPVNIRIKIDSKQSFYRVGTLYLSGHQYFCLYV